MKDLRKWIEEARTAAPQAPEPRDQELARMREELEAERRGRTTIEAELRRQAEPASLGPATLQQMFNKRRRRRFS